MEALEHLEDLVLVVLVDADAVVGDAHAPSFGSPASGHDYVGSGPVVDELEAVRNQVLQHLGELDPVGGDHRQRIPLDHRFARGNL